MDPKTLDEQCGDAAKLAEVVLLNCRGRVDNYLAGYLECAVHRLLTKSKKKSLKVLLLETIAHCLYYNVGATLQLLESKSWTQPVFALWFHTIDSFNRSHDKKVAILGLASLFTIPPNSLPAVIRGGMKPILETLVKVIHELDVQKKEEAEKAPSEDEESSEEDEAIQDDNEDDEETLQQLAAKAHEYYEDEKEKGDSDDDIDPNEDKLEEEEDFTSPIDAVDEVILFTEHIKTFASADQQFYQSILSSLDPKLQEGFQLLFNLAEKRKVEQLQQQQQQPNK